MDGEHDDQHPVAGRGSHQANALRHARRLRRSVKTEDECEFAARHVIKAFEQPFASEEVAAHIGISVGAATTPTNGTTLTQLLTAADQAVYRAKRKGGNSYALAAPGLKPAG